MIGYRLATRRLPLGTDQTGRLLPWVVALLVYLAGLCGVGMIVVFDMLRASDHALAATMTLQIPAEASNARLETVLALLRKTPGIVSVHLLEPAETARLLEPWLGSVPLDELPVPRLIDLRVDPNGGTDLGALRRQLDTVVPDARLDDHRLRSQEVQAAARRIAGVLAVGIGIALLLIAAAVAFVVHAALRVERSVTELLHVLGATDADIAGGFAVWATRLGLLAGALGAAAGLITISALGGAAAILQLAPPNAVNAAADWRVLAVFAGSAAAAALIAMASAWVAVRRRLAAMP
jgi:cell division transport system permease protein